MNLNKIFNIHVFHAVGITCLILILLYVINYFLKRNVDDRNNRRFIFSIITFVLISCFVIINFITRDEHSHLSILLLCCWWFALNFLVNQIIEFFIWNKICLNKGIIVSKLLRDLLSLNLLILTLAAMAYFVFGQSVVGIFTASGVMAIILGYSAQATLGDVFAGLGLNIAKQFDKGDWVQLQGQESPVKVQDINWRFVTFVLPDGNYLSIPNSKIAEGHVINLSQPNIPSSIKILFYAHQSFSPQVVKNFLLSAASQSFKVLKTPPPRVVLSELHNVNWKGPSNLYKLTFFTNEFSATAVTDEILSIAWYQARRLGLKLYPDFPDPPPLPDISTTELQNFLRNMDLFDALTDEDLSKIASGCHYHMYGPPERILTQGQQNESLFVIYSGGVDIYITTETNTALKVASLTAGKYFGEMSLLTGDPCSASIIANEECIIIEIDHNNIASLFETRPELMEDMSKIVVLRKLQNENMKSTTQNAKTEQKNLISRLADRVKNFFASK